MAKNLLVNPFVKWVGGKRQLMGSIMKALPNNIQNYTYVEPFIGGGAVLFHIQPQNAIINDFNSELINVYNVIKNNVEDLIYDLKKHKNESDYFYNIRSLDRSADFDKIDNILRASRFIYLNKTCYNGLYRVNNSGEFNTPFGRYKNPNIINELGLRTVSLYLNTNDIKIFSGDYNEVLKKLNTKTFVYIDPPYHPISESSNFTGYIQGGWDIDDQIRLRETCDRLTMDGIKFLLSNSASEFIRDQYKDYKITTVKACRLINTDVEKRGEIDELLIKNYDK